MTNIVEIEVITNAEAYDILYIPQDELDDFWGVADENWPGEMSVTGPDENGVYRLRLDGDGDINEWFYNFEEYFEEYSEEYFYCPDSEEE